MDRAQTLATLVGMPAARFLAGVWPHHAHVHHGPVSRFRHLHAAPELGDVEAILAAAGRPGGSDRVRVWFEEGGGTFRTLPVDAAQAAALYRGGNVTAVVDNLKLPVLATWMDRLGRELETPMAGHQVNVYASTRSVGTRFHYDYCEVVLVQLRGEKTWRIAPNALPNVGVEYFQTKKPLALLGAPPEAFTPDPARIETHVLRPGSVMFLPRGTWHASETSGGESLGLTLTFDAFTWARLVGEYVTRAFAHDPAWREAAHGALARGGRGPVNDPRFRELLAAALPRLAELDLARVVEGAVGVSAFAPPVRLRITKGVRARGEPPVLRARGASLALDAVTGSVWAGIPAGREFEPGDVSVPEGVAPNVVARSLASLLEAGFLEVVPPARPGRPVRRRR